MIEALVFDFDGTILDTESAEYETWQEVYHRYGQELPLKEWSLIVGSAGHTFDLLAHLEQLAGRSLPRDEIRAERRRRDDMIVDSLRPREGVVDLIGAAKDAGRRLAIASSSPRYWVDRHLLRLGLLDDFPVIASFDETGRGKPDPATYNHALRRLGLAPTQAVAIEDSPNGAAAAAAAGIACLVVPNPVTARMEFPAGTRIWPSLAGVTLEKLERLAGVPSLAD
jgi:HAD superfamily hydrolase (TIGR01509 family)